MYKHLKRRYLFIPIDISLIRIIILYSSSFLFRLFDFVWNFSAFFPFTASYAFLRPHLHEYNILTNKNHLVGTRTRIFIIECFLYALQTL